MRSSREAPPFRRADWFPASSTRRHLDIAQMPALGKAVGFQRALDDPLLHLGIADLSIHKGGTFRPLRLPSPRVWDSY